MGIAKTNETKLAKEPGSFVNFDAHVHLDLMAEPARVAQDALALGLGMLAVTVTPEGFAVARTAGLGQAPGVHLALGLHPWWVADGRAGEAEVGEVCAAVHDVRLVGEVGLDGSPRHSKDGAWERQVTAFARICKACASVGDADVPKVISIHAVHAAGAVLDILEDTGALKRCRCVFHWFSGSTPELWRAIKADAWFSLGERSLSTGKGREYAKLIPVDRLLTETDLPADPPGTTGAADVMASLDRAVSLIAAARKQTSTEVRELVATNARALLA